MSGYTVGGKGKGQGDWERPPTGESVVRLIAFADVGVHDVEYKGDKKQQPKVVLVWALDKADSNGRPHTKIEMLTNSLFKDSKLKLRFKALLRRPIGDEEEISPAEVIGKHAMGYIAESESGSSYFESVERLQGEERTIPATPHPSVGRRYIEKMRKKGEAVTDYVCGLIDEKVVQGTFAEVIGDKDPDADKQSNNTNEEVPF